MPARRGVPQIEVSLDIDANSILTVHAKDLGTGKENSITIKNSNSLSKEEIERIKAEAEANKEADAKRKAEVDKLNQAEGFAYQMKSMLDDEQTKDKFTEDQKKTVTEKADAILEAVKEKNVEKAEELRKDLETYFQPIAAEMYKQAAPQQEAQPANESAGQATQDTSTGKQDAEDVTFEEVK